LLRSSARNAQQLTMPVIGFLSAYPHDSFALYILEAFHRGVPPENHIRA